MFLLGGTEFPETREQFHTGLEQGLRRFGNPRGITEMAGDFPRLATLRIDLSGGRVSRDIRPSDGSGDLHPGIEVADLTVSGSPVEFEGAPFGLRISATDVTLEFDRNAAGQAVLVFTRARSGDLDLELRNDDFRELLLSLIRPEAEKHGVHVRDAQLELENRGPHALKFVTHLTVQKLFVNATLRISGGIDVDESLTARLSQLACAGEGVMGSMACSVIQPHLHRVEQQPFSLAAFPLGEMRLRDIEVRTGAALKIHARLAGSD